MRVALWQTRGYPGDVPANLAALTAVSRAAAAAGAELLLCPECWLCGYNIGAAVEQLAEEHSGASARRIAQIAQRDRLAIAYGYAERDSASGRFYNAVQVIGPAGATLSHYRKAHLFGAAERAAYCAGECFEAPFEFGGFKIGLLICYDIEYPEAARSLALLGAELILVPTALSLEYAAVPDYIVPARAVENQLYVAYCNHAGEENGLRFLGESCLVGADGRALARAGVEEALIVSDLDAGTLARAAGVYPYRSDRRPELYGLVTAQSAQVAGCAAPLRAGTARRCPPA